jgi:hypothetical protein
VGSDLLGEGGALVLKDAGGVEVDKKEYNGTADELKGFRADQVTPVSHDSALSSAEHAVQLSAIVCKALARLADGGAWSGHWGVATKGIAVGAVCAPAPAQARPDFGFPASACHRCPAGWHDPDGAATTPCVPCPPDSFAGGGATACAACPAGLHAPRGSASSAACTATDGSDGFCGGKCTQDLPRTCTQRYCNATTGWSDVCHGCNVTGAVVERRFSTTGFVRITANNSPNDLRLAGGSYAGLRDSVSDLAAFAGCGGALDLRVAR